jgi:competence protein ComEC
MQKDDYKFLKIILGVFVATDILVWGIILLPAKAKNLEMYFLDVGHGDGSLVILPRSAGSGQAGGVKMLIDGGPINGKLEKNLEKILPANDRYIDLVAISHPQLDHFGGLIEVLKNYKVGAVITSGQTSQNSAWQELEKIIKEKRIRRIILIAGDKIKYQNSRFDILSPHPADLANDVNDMSLVAILNSGGIKAFFGGDISAEKEKQLANLYDIDVDILKISHHGSKFSSDPDFLKKASPLISVIEVGKNSYGHPTSQVLEKLKQISSQIFRTDLNGLIKITAENGKLKIYSRK